MPGPPVAPVHRPGILPRAPGVPNRRSLQTAPGPHFLQPHADRPIHSRRKNRRRNRRRRLKTDRPAAGHPSPPTAIQHPHFAMPIITQRPPETGRVQAQVIIVSHYLRSVPDTQTLDNGGELIRRQRINPPGSRIALIVVRQMHRPGNMPPLVAGGRVQVHNNQPRLPQPRRQFPLGNQILRMRQAVHQTSPLSGQF